MLINVLNKQKKLKIINNINIQDLLMNSVKYNFNNVNEIKIFSNTFFINESFNFNKIDINEILISLIKNNNNKEKIINILIPKFLLNKSFKKSYIDLKYILKSIENDIFVDNKEKYIKMIGSLLKINLDELSLGISTPKKYDKKNIIIEIKDLEAIYKNIMFSKNNDKIYMKIKNDYKEKNIGLLFINGIKDNNHELIKCLLFHPIINKQINVNSNCNGYDEYPLFISYRHCGCNSFKEKYLNQDYSLFKILLDYGADLNLRNRENKTIIEKSLEDNNHKNCFSGVNNNRIFEKENIHDKTETIIIIDDEENVNEYQNTEKNCFSDVNSNRAIEERNKRNRTETIIIIDDENENKRLKLNNNNRHLRYHYNERNNNNSNSTLYTIDCMFDNDIIKAYLFNENFDIKKYVNINNVNMIDRYKNLILYYALLKEDKYSILYLLSIDSDKFINLISSENIITGIIFFNIKGILNKIFKSCRSRNLKDYFSDVNSNTELFKIIICNRQSHLYDKFDFIDCIDYYINIHKLKFHINPLVMGMMIEKEEESEKMVYYLLSKEFKIDDFDNALLYSIKLNLVYYTKLFLKYIKKGRRNYINIGKAICSALNMAIETENINILKLILRYFKGNINYVNGKIPIIQAIIKNNCEILKLLIKHGANVNYIIRSKGKNKCSIFYFAITRKNINEDIVKCFIDNKAKMNIYSLKEFEKLFKKL
ncbi:hypothetical protein BCR36DRAFT_442625 [Piromyces finnis]|uniref:Uncharacterized protein n=1 Tax=Piromyces finnis TaxID=1754191 RepID=A0A1Y1UJA7_9FUNG|nr:hypothetical protein BCR36DRAFT_442625 [Piromyces finnis]|eukprot:ORX38141.1 hypothetical protein BCR36DRAFT_442625 [Piromyces finnis]